MEIELNKIKYRNLFNSLSVKIMDNEVTAIIGKNGSGKTSIMNLIYGLDKDFDGEIKIGEKSIDKKIKKVDILNIRKNISYLKQDYEEILFKSTVIEDVKAETSELNMDKLNELLKIFDLDESILKKCYINLSSSEIKKVSIIKTFLSDKGIYLLDDITNGLDNKGKEALLKLLKREKRNNKTIIITSQDSNFLLKVADNIIVLDGYRVKSNTNKYELFSDTGILKRISMDIPSILDFKLSAEKSNIKLNYNDNINDLIKAIYRHAKK